MATTPTTSKAYLFAKQSVRRKTTPKYVKLQMKQFIKVCEGKDKKYKISEKKLHQLEALLKLLIMPKGSKAGETLYSCTVGYQWLFYTAILCTVYRDNPNKRRYETGVLEISRKNFKTYTVATIFILLFLTEPKFSQFFSVAPDGALSREVKKAITETLTSSPLVFKYKDEERFKLRRDDILFKPTQTIFTPLSFSNNRMDGRMPSVWLGDEVGALSTNYPLEAMRSGQINVVNPLGIIISTKYPTIDNPFEDEVAYSKKVLDKLVKDETRFSLLYEPDETKGWETNDLILQQANPAALEIPAIWDKLKKDRALAIAVESKRENFITKHCNIIYQGLGTETYIDVNDVRACKVAHIDWKGKVVYLGVDLSETTDNTAVAMVAVDDDDNILADVFAFIPEGRIEEKSLTEKIDYREFIRAMKCIACGDRVIDYLAVENFIMEIEEKYGVRVQAIGYDRRNAMSSAQKLENAGYNTVEVRQHSSVLHSPTKLLKEKILSGEFQYESNKLLEINFQNSKCTYNTNKDMFLSKIKSRGKIDMVAALVDAVYLLQQDYYLNTMDWTMQVI